MYLYPIADQIENIHFLVAQMEADLTDEDNLCSVYPAGAYLGIPTTLQVGC